MVGVTNVLGTIGDVLYHLSCPYHGNLGTAPTPEGAAQAAFDHLTEQHRDLAGIVSPFADVHVTAVTHVNSSHFDAIQKQKSDLGV